MCRLPHLLGLPIAPTAVHRLGGQAVYTTHRPRGYPPRDVVSLHVCSGQLTWLDLPQLDGSLVGCSFSHYALQTMIHSTAYCFSRV
jgi:hypothetical protein